MRQLLLTLSFSAFCIAFISAQTGCPGCVVNVPPGLAADTIYLPAFPDGEQGTPYNEDYSFRMPMTTTPAAAIDSTIPAGLPISKIEILSLDGLPQGMSWEPNQLVFDPTVQTDGCIKLCGTPTESDTFVLMVKIKVTVFIISQETVFPLRLYIAPKVSNTDGFSMTDFSGCGVATPSFTNNIPSGGNPGITYEWDFGDSTNSVLENPPAHPYTAPGTYVVSYHATIDTTGFILQSATVLNVDCTDPINAPDLYMLITDPDGTGIFDSSPDINNATLPHTFNLNIPLDAGNYTLSVIDEDSGIKGGDDACGTISFNILSNDTIVSGGFRIVLNIIHPVEEVFSTDTVTVYPLPVTPTLNAPNGLSKCSNAPNPILLVSSAGTNNQWWLDGAPIADATDSFYVASVSGLYQVAVSNADGCTAVSTGLAVEIFPTPDSPIYFNTNNLLRLTDTMALPGQYSLQWYNGANPIPGETGFKYCVTENGTYGLLVTDLTTGCTSFYASTVNYNPNFDCTVGEHSPIAGTLNLFPNPAGDFVVVQMDPSVSTEKNIRIWDVAGRLLHLQSIPAGTDHVQVDCSKLPSGVFGVELLSADGNRYLAKLVLVK